MMAMIARWPRRGLTRLSTMAAALSLLTSVLPMAAGATGEIRFFRATDDHRVHAREPNKYERMTKPSGNGSSQVYVEKQPALVISVEGLQAVVVDRHPLVRDVHEALDYLRDRQAWEKMRGAYVVTFYLTKQAARSLNALLSKQSGGLIVLRVSDRTLSLSWVVGPFKGEEWSVNLRERDEARLKEILAPVADKVIWK